MPEHERCYWCRLRPADGLDHLTPRCQGGGDDQVNLVPACYVCNSQKGGKTAEEYGAWLLARARVMATVCERCGAGPGERCVTIREIKQRTITTFHRERKAAA